MYRKSSRNPQKTLALRAGARIRQGVVHPGGTSAVDAACALRAAMPATRVPALWWPHFIPRRRNTHVSTPFRRNGRRTAACAVLGCAGLLVTGALSGTAAADAPGAHPSVRRPAATVQVPHFKAPARSSKKISRKAAKPLDAALPAHSADFDGDGTDDPVFRLSDGEVRLDLGNGTYYTVISADTSQVKDMLLPGDLTGDGKPDLLTITASGALRLHDGSDALRDGGLEAYTTVSTGWQAYNKVITPGDLNGDGRPDLLARSTAGLFLFPGTGDPGAPFGSAQQVGGAGWSQFSQLLGAGDLNGDGIGDVLARNATGLYVYLGSGSAASPFASKTQIGGAGWSQYNQIVGAGDYTADGSPDLLARAYDGTLYFYRGNGDGTFDATRSVDSTGWGEVTQFAGAGNNRATARTASTAILRAAIRTTTTLRHRLPECEEHRRHRLLPRRGAALARVRADRRRAGPTSPARGWPTATCRTCLAMRPTTTRRPAARSRTTWWSAPAT